MLISDNTLECQNYFRHITDIRAPIIFYPVALVGRAKRGLPDLYLFRYWFQVFEKSLYVLAAFFHELKSYAHILDSCQQDWYAVCAIIENTLEALRKEHPHITRVNLRSDEAGCYHNNFLITAVRDAGNRVGITVTQYDFSEPQYGKDVCDRILCPMKSAIRRYCNEGDNVLSAKDMCTALSERPVRGTTACVCSVNESQETLEVKKIENFSRYHNFKFESNGIRV